MKIAGVVVLYHPNAEVIDNILSYSSMIDQLYIVDNTECPDPIYIKYLHQRLIHARYELILNNANLGIATALNTACKKAREEGFDWILTMDQDTCFIDKTFFFLSRPYLNNNNIGIISASFYSKMPFKSDYNTEFYRLKFCISSGSLLKLSAWQQEPYTDMLFIDEVDNDQCIRLGRRGFGIIGSKKIFIKHSLGEALRKRVPFTDKYFNVGIHSPLRNYYIVRNSLYVIRKHGFKDPLFAFNKIYNVLVFIIGFAIFFYPEKRKHFSFIIKGVKDFFSKKYGKLD